jgi:hypothetical protein
MSIQLTFYDIIKLHKLRSKHVFIENSKKMKFQPKKRLEKPCFWGLNIMILQLVKFLIMDFWGHFSISELKDPMVGFKKRIQKNKMNSLI